MSDSIDVPAPKKRTAALAKAQKAYYERTREKRLEQMRERAREAAKQEKIVCESDPEKLLERRKRMMNKYYVFMMNDIEKRIKHWKEDPGISETFKAFLKTNVEPVKMLLPRKFFRLLGKCAIAEKDLGGNPTNDIDGATPTIADIYASSQADYNKEG